MKFFDELKRRNVFRVAGVYAVVGWLLIQVGVAVLPTFGAPPWVAKVYIALILAGFPIALVLAWAFEMTPEGVKLTKNVDEGESIAPKTGRKLDYAILAGLALVIIVVVADRLAPSEPRSARGPQREDGESAAPAPPDGLSRRESVAEIGGEAPASDPAPNAASVAVLPFVALSSGEDDGYFADGLTDEILNSLTGVPGLLVTARTSSFYFKGKDTPIPEVAEKLGVAHVVEGSVRRAGDMARVTVQLIRARDGFHLWSQTYDRPLDDIFEIQTEIAENIAGALSIFLDDASREAISRSGTRNVEAFKAFAKGRDMLDRAHANEPGATLWEANALFERAMALDPKFAAPALAHHDAFAHLLMDGPNLEMIKPPDGEIAYSEAEAQRRLLADLNRAIDSARTPTERITAELNREFFSPTWRRMPGLIERFRREANADTAGAIETAWLEDILLFNRELDMLRKFSDSRLKTNPLNPAVWSLRAELEAVSGDLDAAEAALARGRATAGDHHWLRGDDIFIAAARRDKEALRRFLKRPEFNPVTWGWRQTWLAAIDGDYEKAAALADQMEAESDQPIEELLIVYHEIGDKERARALTQKVDALTGGPAIFARTIAVAHNRLFFDIADAPNFAARLKEAGIDPAGFRPMPRLSLQTE